MLVLESSHKWKHIQRNENEITDLSTESHNLLRIHITYYEFTSLKSTENYQLIKSKQNHTNENELVFLSEYLRTNSHRWQQIRVIWKALSAVVLQAAWTTPRSDYTCPKSVLRKPKSVLRTSKKTLTSQLDKAKIQFK